MHSVPLPVCIFRSGWICTCAVFTLIAERRMLCLKPENPQKATYNLNKRFFTGSEAKGCLQWPFYIAILVMLYIHTYMYVVG